MQLKKGRGRSRWKEDPGTDGNKYWDKNWVEKGKKR